MSLINTLIEKRNKAIIDARKVVDIADGEKRSMSAEERQSYDKAMADQASLKTQIDERQALESAETELRSSAGRRTSVEQPGSEQRAQGEAIEVEFRGKKMTFTPRSREHILASQNHNDAFRNYLTGERRTAASFANDVLADGGYLHTDRTGRELLGRSF